MKQANFDINVKWWLPLDQGKEPEANLAKCSDFDKATLFFLKVCSWGPQRRGWGVCKKK